MRRLPKLLLLLPLLACHPARVTRTMPSGGAGGAAGGGAGDGPSGGAGGTPGVGSTVPDAASRGGEDAAPSTVPAAGAACAEEEHQAEPPPLDLLLLVDNSVSMDGEVPGTMKTLSAVVRDALVAFTGDPASDGMGIGLKFFPTPAVITCVTDADCPGGRGSGGCIPRQACGGPDTIAGATIRCPPGFTFLPASCPAGTSCVDVGVCSLSAAECYAVGQPCPGGMAGDLCRPAPKVCHGAPALNCSVADYEKLDMPILPLPAAHEPLVRILAYGESQFFPGVFPSGGPGTPHGPALAGALNRLRQHQSANPTHRVAVVMATDGLPDGCMPADAAGIAALAARARMERPGIATYVIGVHAEGDPDARPLLDRVAAAGGTGSAFIVDATADLGQRFRDALDKIRVAQLPCEFAVPQPSRGAIDFAKVNVRFTAGGAPQETLPYVGSVDRCDPMRGGWYYDVPPEQATPGRVLICPASCTRFTGDPAGRVSLAYGCKTVVIE
jgi:hypothetical protein